MSTPRYSDLTREDLDDKQRAVWDAIAAGPRKAVPRIFHLYLHSPEMAEHIQALGAVCRYGSIFPPQLSEAIILTIANHFDCAYEWSVHVNEARKAGIGEDVISAIQGRREPVAGDNDTRLLWRFASTYLETNAVPDALFDEARNRFGYKAIVELAGIIGYYSMLAMALRIFEVPPRT